MKRTSGRMATSTNKTAAFGVKHKSRATIDLLKDAFGDRLISRFGPVNWPPRSCDSTPLDYFLCGYVKSLVYADKPQTLDHLEDNIRRVIADIRPQMLEKVIENWTSRLDYIRASRDSHMLEIIFKINLKFYTSKETPFTSKEQETFVRQKLHKMSLIETNGLPYQTVYVNNIYFMITPNIDVTEANGVVGKLAHIETNDEGLVKTILLEFPDIPQIGEKLRRIKTISPYLYKITE
ncbi:uncharacterized protein TNCV_1054141 [Trichonephila clavipes]|nr:uncharacterized protein TNCV_1054141 [Trichonephila clavipes]